MQEIGAEQARKRFPELLNKAHRGGYTIVTKHGIPYAAIVSVDQCTPARETDLLALRGSGAGLWGNDPAQWVDELRDEWT